VKSGFQDEIKQTKPFDSLEQEAFLALQRTADQLQGRVAEWLKAFALSPTQYNALRILRGAGEAGLPCSEIAERMINRDPDITRLLDRLEKRGLTRRSRDSKDRRVINAYITREGLQLLKKMDAPVQEFQKVLLGHVGERKLKILIDILCATRNG
jgi:MarR family transcriptional regulator, organic hydroperoxide resistance regulator